MPIIKAAWRGPRRGRTKAASWGRRAHYLRAEHGRESAVLLDRNGHEVDTREAVQRLGGSRAAYHESIIAPSDQEVHALAERYQGDEARAAREIGLRIAQRVVKGRDFILAIHRDKGDQRWHYHLAIRGPPRERLYGPNGNIQRAWNAEWRGREQPIRDWQQHQRWKILREELARVQQEQRALDRERYEAIKEAPRRDKVAVARVYEEKALELIERRYLLEVMTLGARYAARGTSGSAEHRAEEERAEHRRTGALHRLERRLDGREDPQPFSRATAARAAEMALSRAGLREAEGDAARTALELARGDWRSTVWRGAERAAGSEGARAVQHGRTAVGVAQAVLQRDFAGAALRVTPAPQSKALGTVLAVAQMAPLLPVRAAVIVGRALAAAWAAIKVREPERDR